MEQIIVTQEVRHLGCYVYNCWSELWNVVPQAESTFLDDLEQQEVIVALQYAVELLETQSMDSAKALVLQQHKDYKNGLSC